MLLGLLVPYLLGGSVPYLEMPRRVAAYTPERSFGSATSVHYYVAFKNGRLAPGLRVTARRDRSMRQRLGSRGAAVRLALPVGALPCRSVLLRYCHEQDRCLPREAMEQAGGHRARQATPARLEARARDRPDVAVGCMDRHWQNVHRD